LVALKLGMGLRCAGRCRPTCLLVTLGIVAAGSTFVYLGRFPQWVRFFELPGSGEDHYRFHPRFVNRREAALMQFSFCRMALSGLGSFDCAETRYAPPLCRSVPSDFAFWSRLGILGREAPLFSSAVSAVGSFFRVGGRR